jgi:muramoyltetrapeptide carboxypeptidase
VIKPKKLEKGDVIAFISPSSNLASIAPHRIDRARHFLEQKGFRVKLFPTVYRTAEDGSAGTAEERAKDIHDAFSDPEVKAIISTIGGVSCNELLSKLDYNLIKNNPKIFCGFSDVSILHYAINKKCNIVTFYGPAAMAQFAEFPKPFDYTYDHFIKALTGKIGQIKPSEKWTDEFLDWVAKEDLKRPRALHQNTGFQWLKNGKASGKIMGGCLHSILQLKGTEYEPDYSGKILFLETPEGQDFSKGEPLPYVRAQLYDLKNAKVFQKIKGLIFGRAFGYTAEEKRKLAKYIGEVCSEYDFPIVCNFDIGHTEPIITIPLGANITMDSEKNLVDFDECGVEL